VTRALPYKQIGDRESKEKRKKTEPRDKNRHSEETEKKRKDGMACNSHASAAPKSGGGGRNEALQGIGKPPARTRTVKEERGGERKMAAGKILPEFSSICEEKR